MSLIYLDYAATTPLSEAVKNTLIKSISDQNYFFNSGSSTYDNAEVIANKIEFARKDIASTINVVPREIIFTSGATESNNLAIKGVAFAYKKSGNHIITSKAEHKAVLDVCAYLETQGFNVTYLNVNSRGSINITELKEAIIDKTILISLMAVNNELGTKNDLYSIGQIAKDYGIIFHVDAAQAYGKVDLDIEDMGIDLLSMSGHKIYAPKGVGFLYVRSKSPRVRLHKQIHGGMQEFNLRGGTLANHQIFALVTACKEIFEKKIGNYQFFLELRNLFLSELFQSEVLSINQVNSLFESGITSIKINTDLENSYPGILNITLKDIKAETLLAMLDGVCLSMGSACNSNAVQPSHVLVAIGLSAYEADSTIRISFGEMTTKQEVLSVTRIINKKIKLLKAIAPCDKSLYV